jgi:hypothetical protein
MQHVSDYSDEAVDRLPFNTPEKSERYRTRNYRGAVGRNWYLSDPTLQQTMAYYLQPDELAVAEPHLRDIGALMGGPVARWAEQTDRNPARLERYDRWGHDVSEVIQPPSFTESKRAVLGAQKALRDDARSAGFKSSMPLFAANYLLDQADIGLGCALGTGGGMVKSLVAAFAPAATVAKTTGPGYSTVSSGLRPTATARCSSCWPNPKAPPIPAAARRASWCCEHGATARATVSASGGSRTSWAPGRWPRARSSSSTPRPSCCPASPTPASPALANPARRSRHPTARAWAG